MSILTAVTRPDLLPRLYSSIASQQIDWEWIVQLDGEAIEWRPGPGDCGFVEDDRRVWLERNAKPLGSGTTRNLALIRATGDLVLCVDDDDLLYPDSLGGLCAALAAWPQCFGAWGRTDLLTEGDADPAAAPGRPPEVFKAWPAPGVIQPGTIGAYFERIGEFPVHVGAVMWRRSHLVAVGGYGALPRSVDTNPFLAAEALFPVCYVDTPVYRYRLHGGQMSSTPDYQRVKDGVHAFTFERARELRRLLGSETGHPPDRR
ncbi:glycosyltransferase [Streptomyces resistomycificus]|uniref:glycosyltransferase n=1 Tax=Streptomyces resistomycificus TaxID=67356 RepID=UPI0012FF3146|nr:glycosyltransferase [Streptomyces resistomycificus]